MVSYLSDGILASPIILSWKNSQLTLPVKIIKYEDLVTKTNEVFFDILIFLNKHAKTNIDICKNKSM